MESSDAEPAGRTHSTTSEPVDLTSTNPQSLSRAVYARRSEYTRRRCIRIKIGTWNVAACPGTDKDLARWFVDGEGLDATQTETKKSSKNGNDQEKIDLYVLGLQEINELTAPSQYMTWIYAPDTTATDKWKAALKAGLPDEYQLIATEQLAGMLLLVYASSEVAPIVSNVSTTSVATGALGYLGNKGAVCARIVLGEATNLVFVNCHLASGVESSYVERRIWQVQQVLQYARFEPITVGGVTEDEKGQIGDEDFAFWFGDLNSRLDRLPGDDIRRLLMLHTQGQYDLSKKSLRREDSLEGEGVVVQRLSDSSDDAKDEDQATAAGKKPLEQESNKSADNGADDDSFDLPDPDEFPLDPSEDPASLQTTLTSLLPHDQLRRLMKDRKVFHEGWREGPITFLPSYKYDVGTVALFDSSEKQRPPSWCDRVLYRTRKDKEAFEKKIQEEEESRKRDEEMKAQGMENAGDDDQVLFSYDPDNDGDDHPSSSASPYDAYDENDDGEEQDEELGEQLRLDLYTSHQRITSSDHKPISTIFTLDYDAIVPDLKAKVHAEVARELDRAENEGRPVVTIVVDYQGSRPRSESDVADRSELAIDFGRVRFLEKMTSSLTLANTGSVPATFAFVERPTTEDPDMESNFSWLTTSFVRPEESDDGSEPVDLGKKVTLEPGETVNAHLEALIDDVRQARMLNEGKATLDEVLVLRVMDGRDHFIPVHGDWAPTCIGRSVEELIRVRNGGIREFCATLAKKNGKLSTIPYDLPAHHAAPKELFELTEATETLAERALADAQMLDDCEVPTAPGWPFEEATWAAADKNARTTEVINVIDALDRDERILSAFAPEVSSIQRLEAVCEAFLLFLAGLIDGIITTPLWNRIEQAALPSLTQSVATAVDSPTVEDDKTTILDILAAVPNHNICFVFLTTTLARIAAELAPLTKADLEAIKDSEGASRPVLAALGRKSLSFRRSTGPGIQAVVALNRRRAKEKKFAEVFGGLVCRGPPLGKVKDRKSLEEKQTALIGLFLRRRGE
ncbi:putative inositol-1,4,5-trisphosphate 5-phosphatase 3 [Triangularia verruculosa]|uniref:Inositol-1,4,5-trisphosphate 5-phosphatase 3 n=1 Tax=Triangularia verruculosa TaxID=2587418 RepID=A0AAN6XER4_9PEZI|nr:putative inositol-1,4,5-trisphosphate 5-phosphatase 3 [Triangularia verruculosa]